MSGEIKVGDTVVCIDNESSGGAQHKLEKGKTYLITNIQGRFCSVESLGATTPRLDRFKVVPETCEVCNHSPEYCNCS